MERWFSTMTHTMVNVNRKMGKTINEKINKKIDRSTKKTQEAVVSKVGAIGVAVDDLRSSTMPISPPPTVNTKTEHKQHRDKKKGKREHGKHSDRPKTAPAKQETAGSEVNNDKKKDM